MTHFLTLMNADNAHCHPEPKAKDLNLRMPRPLAALGMTKKSASIRAIRV